MNSQHSDSASQLLVGRGTPCAPSSGWHGTARSGLTRPTNGIHLQCAVALVTALMIPFTTSATLYRITGGSVTMTITEGMANSISEFDAYFDATKSRAETLSDAAPGNAPFVEDDSGVALTDPIRPYGVVPSPFPGVPGSSRSPQKTTLVFDPADVMGTWTLSNDSFGFTGNTTTGEQIALTSMQRYTGPFTGVLVYGDFAIRRTSATELKLTSNIDFLNAEFASITNPAISVVGDTLTISGAMQIDQALFLLDSSAVVGTTFGSFTLTATIAPVPPPLITQLTVDASTATLQATNGIPASSYTVLTTTNTALPMTSWEIAATGTFADDGQTTNTIPIVAGEAARFFRLQQP